MYKVLIIDDEPWARKVVTKLGKFKTYNLEIIGEAEDGNSGLLMIQELKPHLVITDMRMPGLDGVGLLKAISEQYPEVVIIAMSGYNDFIYLKQSIRAGVIEYLLKPINPSELDKALKRCALLLDKAHKNEVHGFGTLHLFDDIPTLDTYLNFRQKIIENLLAHRQETIEKLFDGMSDLFKEKADWINDEIASKILHDFTRLLEEFIFKSGLDIQEVMGDDVCKAILNNKSISMDYVFDELKDLYKNTIHRIIEKNKSKGQLDIEEIKNYIDNHYEMPISLESIAGIFYVSKEHLSRTFKVKTNITINDYLVNQRMEKAKKLLEEQDLAIKDIAIMTGYSDLPYFYRIFKKYCGLTPGEYKKHHTDINNVQ